MRRPSRRVVAAGAGGLAVALVATVGLAGCSGDDPAGGGARAAASSAPAAAVTRWWSNPAAAAGSTIDPEDPRKAARELSPSRTAYCAMLRDTVSAGRSVLPGQGTSGRPLAAEAFVAELTAVAPAPAAAAWRTLAPAVLRLSDASGGAASLAATGDGKRLGAAAETVNRDAASACRVDLGR